VWGRCCHGARSLHCSACGVACACVALSMDGRLARRRSENEAGRGGRGKLFAPWCERLARELEVGRPVIG
jgi:hypothetical protein